MTADSAVDQEALWGVKLPRVQLDKKRLQLWRRKFSQCKFRLKVSRDESIDTLLVEINALQNWPIPPFWSVLTWWNTFLIGELGVLQKATSAVQAEEGLCKQHQILKLSWTSKCYPYCVQSLTCCCHEVHVHWLHHLARNKAEEIKRTYMTSTTCNQLNRRPVDA